MPFDTELARKLQRNPFNLSGPDQRCPHDDWRARIQREGATAKDAANPYRRGTAAHTWWNDGRAHAR